MKSFKYFDNFIFSSACCFVFILVFYFFRGTNAYAFIYSLSYCFIIFCFVAILYRVDKVNFKVIKNFFKIDVVALYNLINSDASKFRIEECPRQLSVAAKYSDSHMSSMCCNSSINAVYLGRGFEFTPQHTRKLHDLMSRNGLTSNKYEAAGSPQIHNLEKFNKQSLYISSKDLTGHTIVFGTTGSGKTRAYELLISQAIMRNDVVIVIDPKGDVDLKANSYKVAKLLSRHHGYEVLDIANLARSTKTYNLLGASSKPAQIADKLSSLMKSSGSSGDTFASYANEAICGAIVALQFMQRKVTIQSIHSSISINAYYRALISFLIDVVIKTKSKKAVTYFYNRVVKGLDVDLSIYPKGKVVAALISKVTPDDNASLGSKKKLSIKDKTTCLRDIFNYLYCNYSIDIPAEVELLLSLAEKDPVFFSKVTAGVAPMLNALSISGLDHYLSSKEHSLTLDDVYNGNKILYVALHSLKDATVASYVGKLFLSDLASFASDIYQGAQDSTVNSEIAFNNSVENYAEEFKQSSSQRRVSVFIDEASEITNEALVQLLNKSRGANLSITLACQSFADLVKRTGSVSHAQQIIANCNTMISLRVKDEDTANVVTSALPKTVVYDRVKSIYSSTENSKLSSNDSTSYSLKPSQSELFPNSALMSLPNFEYVAKLADGRFVKGIFPIIDVNKTYKENFV